ARPVRWHSTTSASTSTTWSPAPPRSPHRPETCTHTPETEGSDAMDRLVRLYEEFGQSPWLDNLKRGYLTSGELARLRDEGIRGQTSNPTIFQKAIEGSADYDDQFRTLVKGSDDIIEDYWAMVLQDINGALDVFAPLYESSKGGDGFVSVEVAPDIAHDT